MRHTILSIMFIGGLFGGLSVPEQALEKLEGGDYNGAIALYDSTLVLPDYDDEHRAIHFNIGQAHIQSDSFDLAQAAYSKCTQLSPAEKGLLSEREIASSAWNNIGLARIKRGNEAQQSGGGQMAIGGNNMPNMGQPQGGDASKAIFDEALKSFKEALKMDPENETARFNYELLKKRIQQAEQQQEKKDQENQDQDQDQNQNQQDDKQDQENKEDQNKQNQEDQGKPDKNKQDNAQENKEKKGQDQQNQGESDQQMSEQQAKQLLEAMNEKEKQFIQQLEKRAKKKGRKKRSDGPDW